MKHLFLITAIWFLISEQCNKGTVSTQQPTVNSAFEGALELPKSADSMAMVSDSLKHQLCYRIWRTEQGLDALKKKHWPQMETLKIVRAIDPIYCKSNNPPY